MVKYKVTGVTKSNQFGFKKLSVAYDYMIWLYSYLVTSRIYIVYYYLIRAFKYIPIDHINRGNRGNFGNRAFIHIQEADLKFFYIGNFGEQRGNLK